MAEKWHDINAPGVWQKPNQDATKSGTGSGTTQPADATDAADDTPQDQKPLVKLSEGKFVPPDEGVEINKKCSVQVSVEYLDNSAKSMQKVTFSLYANYKDATSNLSHYVDGYEKDGVAQAEMTMYPPPGYQEGYNVDYFFKAEHIRGEKVIDSEDLTLPMDTQSIILQKGDYDENGAAAYNKDQSGDNFKPNNVVKKLQGDLITTNFLPKGSDDGFFGDQTDKAVKEFQDYAIKLVRMKRSVGKTENTDKGLDQQSPDGIVGEKTRDELDKWLSNGWIKPVPTLRHGEYDDTGVDNGKGKRGTDDHHQGTPVVEAQNNLQKVGVYSDGVVDGWFYDKMLDAVKQFQDAAAKGKFIINEVLTEIGEILSGHQKGEHCPKTQEYLKKVVDKGGKVPPKPANSFDIDKAIEYLKMTSVPPYGKGECATHVRKGLLTGGIEITPHPVPAKEYGPYLEKYGFEEISTNEYNPIKGDIIIMQSFAGASSNYGHIEMYSGTQWISDFIQDDLYPGSKYKENKAEYRIYRWKVANK
jgi:peptidoglycan hydrolase-like protein with peptidoglycan-binding domain